MKALVRIYWEAFRRLEPFVINFTCDSIGQWLILLIENTISHSSKLLLSLKKPGDGSVFVSSSVLSHFEFKGSRRSYLAGSKNSYSIYLHLGLIPRVRQNKKGPLFCSHYSLAGDVTSSIYFLIQLSSESAEKIGAVSLSILIQYKSNWPLWT